MATKPSGRLNASSAATTPIRPSGSTQNTIATRRKLTQQNHHDGQHQQDHQRHDGEHRCLRCRALLEQAAGLDLVRLGSFASNSSIFGASASTTSSGSTPRLTSARTVSVGTRLRRQTSGYSWSSTNVANWLSGTIRPLGVGTCSELQGLERDPLLVGGARDDVDQVDVVAHLRHRRAGDRGVEDARPERAELTPSCRASSWSTRTRSCRAGSIQS